MSLTRASCFRSCVCLLTLLCGTADSATARADETNQLDLSGNWSFQLDPDDVGTGKGWFRTVRPASVRLPGSIQSQGIGLKPTLETHWTGSIRQEVIQMSRYAPYRSADNFKMPFWLQPKQYYVGPAWYQRNVSIPPDWAGQRVALHLERCHWFTKVWVDDREAGDGESLSAPHVYDLTRYLSPGEHRITIRVDNRVLIKVGENSHSVTDHTQTNWNGIVGKIELRAGAPVWIDDVQVFPDAQRRTARVIVGVKNQTGNAVNSSLTLTASIDQQVTSTLREAIRIDGTSTERVVELPLGPDAQLWDEHQPNLYTLTVKLAGDAQDQVDVTFGMRELATKGTQFTLNGQPIFFRGTLECCIFPLTGYPPTDVVSWKQIVAQLQGIRPESHSFSFLVPSRCRLYRR